MFEDLSTLTILGWLGIALVLAGYIGITLKKWDSQDDAYHWLNFLGAAGIVASAYETQNWAVITLNGVWLLVALYGLLTKKKE